MRRKTRRRKSFLYVSRAPRLRPYLTSSQDEDKRKWQQLLVYIEKAALYSKMLDEQMSKAKSNYSSQQSAQKSTAPTAPVGKMPKFEVQRDKLSRKPKSKGAIASTKSKSRKRVIEVSDGSDVEHDAKRARLDDSVSEEPTGAFRQPALVTGARLKEYQLEGVAWMVALFQNGLSGILGESCGRNYLECTLTMQYRQRTRWALGR